MGLVTTMAYDSATAIFCRSLLADNGSAPHFNATSSFRYDAYGHVISAKDPVGIATTFAYDASSNLVTRVASRFGQRHHAFRMTRSAMSSAGRTRTAIRRLWPMTPIGVS